MFNRSVALAVADTRFGFIGTPGEKAGAQADPRDFFGRSLATPASFDYPSLAPTRDVSFDFVMKRITLTEVARQQRIATGAAPALPADFVGGNAVVDQALDSRLQVALQTRAPLVERLVMHWRDHFTISAFYGSVAYFSDAFEREAIRPHILGRFADMAKAAILHPAMIYYLDNRSSAGPGSATGRASRGRRGLNENLARESLELHTLGADGGYGQNDVIDMAKILTGWSVELKPGRDGIAPGMGFFPQHHEPGPKTVLGKTYREAGPDEAMAVIDDLARHPSTARNVTRRMVRHFVGHGLPGLEARMAEVFRRTDGDLGALTRALLADDEAWGPPRKIRSPIEFVLATTRLLGGLPEKATPLRALQAMGQRFWAPPSPKGWPDEDDAWAAPDAIKTRLDWAAELAANAPAGTDARALLETAFGPAASAETRRAVERAADGRQALTILLLSPEFQRR